MGLRVVELLVLEESENPDVVVRDLEVLVVAPMLEKFDAVTLLIGPGRLIHEH